MSASSQPPQTPPTDSNRPDRSTQRQELALEDVSALAELLDRNDQVRLIARLLESLPPKHRGAIVEFGLNSFKTPGEKLGLRVDLPRGSPIGPTLWDRLFDPARKSELYSAPQRFDLATIFVVTAAYSILFGAMSSLNEYFGPVTKVAVGVLVTVVAVAQAFYKDVANPRGVSVVTGAITQSTIMILLEIFAPRLLLFPGFIVVVLFGVLGGAFSGYLAGVLVGGVFLVADALRKRFTRETDELHDIESNDKSGVGPER